MLGHLGDPRAVPALHEILKSPKAKNRLYAAGALARLGDPLGLPGVIDFLKDPDAAQRRSAANLLGQFHEKAAVDALIEATKDESPDVRIEAASWLGMFADRSAIEALEALQEDEAVLTSGAKITVREVAVRGAGADRFQDGAAGRTAGARVEQAHLRFGVSPLASRTEYQAGQLPTFDVEARNVGNKAVTAASDRENLRAGPAFRSAILFRRQLQAGSPSRPGVGAGGEMGPAAVRRPQTR